MYVLGCTERGLWDHICLSSLSHMKKVPSFYLCYDVSAPCAQGGIVSRWRGGLGWKLFGLFGFESRRLFFGYFVVVLGHGHHE